jgi:hypothetical protein
MNEIEKLRELLREIRRHNSSGLTRDTQVRIDAALSQQAEPTETYIAVEMATAAAQAFRDGQAAVEQDTAQDERETFEQAFEAHMRLGGYSNPEKHQDGSYVSSAMEFWWQGWKARAACPAHTEQQPVAQVSAVVSRKQRQFTVVTINPDRLHVGTLLYAAPIAQPIRMPPRPEVDIETAENLKREDGYFKGFHEGAREMWDNITHLNATPIAQTAQRGETK